MIFIIFQNISLVVNQMFDWIALIAVYELNASLVSLGIEMSDTLLRSDGRRAKWKTGCRYVLTYLLALVVMPVCVCFVLSSMLFVCVLLFMMSILKCCLVLSISRCATVWLWMVFKRQQHRRLVPERNEELWVEAEETSSRESWTTPRPERNPQRTLNSTYLYYLRGTATVCLPLACIRPVNLPLRLFMLRILSLWEKLDVNDSIDRVFWESFKMKFD